jgi:8-oxo-dGTP pyrophosphatase MutT (NUDIX family)
MPGSGDDELLSVVDATGRPLPPLGRAEVHRRGLWHESFHCLVVRTTSPATVVLQRRRAVARSFPGRLDLTATGHLVAGEAPLDGRRELREEVGIDADPDALIALGVRLMADDSGEGGHNRERTHVFLLADDRPLTAFPLDPAEVAGLVELTAADLLSLLQEPDIVVPCVEIGADPGARPVAAACRAADLVPAVDGYWTVLAVMAQRFVAGDEPLAI